APCGFQDALTPMLCELGFDVCDPRDVFMHHTDRTGLFIPDKHFSPEGNRVLLAALRSHVDSVAHVDQKGVAGPEHDAKGVHALPTAARPSKTQVAPAGKYVQPGNDALPSPPLRGGGAKVPLEEHSPSELDLVPPHPDPLPPKRGERGKSNASLSESSNGK